jgi:hypothetical protein
LKSQLEVAQEIKVRSTKFIPPAATILVIGATLGSILALLSVGQSEVNE